MNPKPKHLPAPQRRTVIVEAVIELAAERNPSEITTAAIARRMNLTQGALFRHFPSKEAVWEAVMEWVTDRLLTLVEQAACSSPSPLGALEAIFLAHVDFVAQHPGAPRMMFGELQHPGETPAKRLAQGLMNRYGERLKAVIEAGQSGGEISPEIDSAAAATVFLGSIQGLVMRSMLAGDLERMRVEAAGVFSIFRSGMGGGR